MCKEMRFFIYLIERYADSRDVTASKILIQWDKLGLTDFIYDMYELYHVEAIENAFDDIDKMILEKQCGDQELLSAVQKRT